MLNEYSYGVITYNSINIGDEIQSIASMRFLPEVDEYVYREQIKRFIPRSTKQTKCIMNAWWMWKPENFPPSKYIEPLLISMYIRPEIRKKFLTKQTRKYLLEKGPVGCRDIGTYNWLKEEKIPAYFSGCLTLTLERNRNIEREDYILCVDTKEELVSVIRERTQRPVYSISRMLSPFYSAQQRLELAKIQLLLYQNAHLIVSSRLHVILPSLALETPVLRVISDEKEMGEVSRYSGYENFFYKLTNQEIIENPNIYDFDNPIKNPDVYIPYRKSLIEKCSDFTKYNNTKSLIEFEMNPLVKMIEMNRYSYRNVIKNLYFSADTDIKTVMKKKKQGYDKYSLVDNSELEMNLSNVKMKMLYYIYLILSKIYKKEHYNIKKEKVRKYLCLK